MHTAPPKPEFIHCAQDSAHPPLGTPAQFRSGRSTEVQEPAITPTPWNTSAGAWPPVSADAVKVKVTEPFPPRPEVRVAPALLAEAKVATVAE